MTTTVRVQRREGNKDVALYIETRNADGTWSRQGGSALKEKGDEFSNYVYGTQRLVIEETGEFTS